MNNQDILLSLILISIAYLAYNYAQLYFEVIKLKEALIPGQASRIELYAIINGKKELFVKKVMKVSDAPLKVFINKITDIKGNVAPVEGLPAWSLTDSTLGELAVAEDGMSAMFTPAGPVGALKVQVLCDADMGEGVFNILGEGEIELIAGDAAIIELGFGE